MKTTALMKHICIALVLTCLAIANDFIFSQLLTGQLSVKLNLSFIIFLYLGYLIWQSNLTAGKITLLVINLCVLLVGLYAMPQINTLMLICMVTILITRSLLRYSSVVAVLADLGLCLISVGTVFGVINNGNSFISAIWCFLLLQALHTLIPGKKSTSNEKDKSITADIFDHSLHAAENALQEILRKG